MKHSLANYSLNIEEEAYHAYPAWSYSVIAKYAKEGFSAIKNLHDKVEPTASMKFGSLFDSILTRGKKTLDYYAVMDMTVPDAERKALDYISSRTDEVFADLSPEYIYNCCQECGYQTRWKMDTVYNKLLPYKDYYDMTKSGKEIVSQQEWDDAVEMAKIYRNDPYLKDIFGTKNTDDVEYLYQLQFVQDVTLPSGKTVTVKCMPDLIVVNHKDKTVQPVDLKTSAMPAYEFSDNFLKYRYDIQAQLYSDILTIIMKQDDELKEYHILPYLFSDISRSDKVPVTYVYDQTDESQANGFSFKSGDKTYQYKHWSDLLDEILEYEAAEAKVPSYIRLDGPNYLLDILGR